jgi:ADP-ribose pyrophosphatase
LRDRPLGTRTVFEGRVIRVRVDEVEAADGHRSEREVVEHLGAVGIVAVHRGELVLVRQYRHATGEELLEIPAGKLAPGEEPAQCAARELVEETNLHPRRLESLATFYTTPGFTNELFHLFLADDCEPRRGRLEDGEVLSVERVPIGEVDALLERGEIRDAKTLVGLSFLLRRRR